MEAPLSTYHPTPEICVCGNTQHHGKIVSKEVLLAATNNGLAIRLLSKGKNVPNVAIVDNKETWQKGKLEDPKSKEDNQK